MNRIQQILIMAGLTLAAQTAFAHPYHDDDAYRYHNDDYSYDDAYDDGTYSDDYVDNDVDDHYLAPKPCPKEQYNTYSPKQQWRTSDRQYYNPKPLMGAALSDEQW